MTRLAEHPLKEINPIDDIVGHDLRTEARHGRSDAGSQ
jgi:hypothetical protein